MMNGLMHDNQSLWLTQKRTPFAAGAAPYSAPDAGEIAVRARAVAVNPMDRAVQNVGDIIAKLIA